MARMNLNCALLTGVLSVFSTPIASGFGQPEPSPQEIIDRTVEVYKTCDSYHDEGEVRTTFIGGAGAMGGLQDHISVKPFRTRFVRPGQFRFEYSDGPMIEPGGGNLFVAWQNGGEFRSWSGLYRKTEKATTPRQALLMGFSGGAAHIIPSMLFPFEKATFVLELADPERAGQEELDGVDCYKIKADGRGDSITVWIDTEHFLIRQIEESADLGDFQTRTIKTYDPQINIEIDPEEFSFTPEEMPQPPEIVLIDLAARQPDKKAEDILARMKTNYASLKLYTDEGKLRSDMFSDRGVHVNRLAFRTRFARPDQFRFGFWKLGDAGRERPFEVWIENGKFYTWWGVHRGGAGEVESLSFALAGPTGVSGGTAVLITPMLVPRQVETSGSIGDLRLPRVLREEMVDGVECYVIEGIPQRGQQTEMNARGAKKQTILASPELVWIGKDDLLIRRVSSATRFETFTSVDTISITPQVDNRPADNEFVFDPDNPDEH